LPQHHIKAGLCERGTQARRSSPWIIFSTARSGRRERRYDGYPKVVETLDRVCAAAESSSTLAGDGVFSIEEDGALKLVDLKTNKTTVLVKKSDVQDV
jgi:hypothetical protein